MKPYCYRPLALLAVLLSLSAWAANPIFDAGPHQPGHFGIRAAMEMTAPSEEGDNAAIYRNGIGTTLRATWSKPLWRNMYVEPQLGLFYNTIRMKDMFDPDHTSITESGHTGGSIRNLGMRVGLMVGYRLDFTDDVAVSLFTGPRFNYGFLAKQHWVVEIDNSKTTFWRNMYRGESGMRRCDAQWAFGIAITFRHKYYFEMAGAAALTNMLHGNYYKNEILHRNNFALGVGYNF